MYLIYEGHLLLFTYDLLSLSIYSYYFILFFFYLLYISFIYFFLSLFFVSIYFSLYILFICFLYSLIFSFVLPENFIFVFYFWFTFMDISLYFLPHTKKEVRFPNLSFLYFIFLRSLDAAAKSSASLSFCSLFSIACSKVLARALNHFPPLLTATTNLSSLSSQWMFRIPSSRDSPDC